MPNLSPGVTPRPRAPQLTDEPRPLLLGHEPSVVKLIRGGEAHRCKVCDLAATTEQPHCPVCHRTFSGDALARDHYVTDTQEHRDPPRGTRIMYNRFGTPVFCHKAGKPAGG